MVALENPRDDDVFSRVRNHNIISEYLSINLFEYCEIRMQFGLDDLI